MPFSNVSSVGKENTDTKPVCILLHRYTYLYITFLFMRLFIGIFTSPPLQDIIRGFIYIFCVILFVARARVRSYFSTILNRLIHFNSPLISFFGGVNKSQIIQLSNSDSRTRTTCTSHSRFHPYIQNKGSSAGAASRTRRSSVAAGPRSCRSVIHTLLMTNKSHSTTLPTNILARSK